MTPTEYSALLLSLRVALTAVLISLLPGMLIALLLARKAFHGKTLIEVLVHLPLVLPPVVTGYALLLLFGRYGPLGGPLNSLGISIAFSSRGAVLASAIIGFPLLVRSMRTAFEMIDPGLISAAAVLGDTPLKAFVRVTLPLALPGVLTGCILAFARSLGEFGATMMLCGNIAGETQTIPLAVYSAMQAPGGDAAALRLAAVSALLSIGALAASNLFSARLRRTLTGAPRDA